MIRAGRGSLVVSSISHWRTCWSAGQSLGQCTFWKGLRGVPNESEGWERGVMGIVKGQETHSPRCSRRITLKTDDASIA
jgi:hypothetical protein